MLTEEDYNTLKGLLGTAVLNDAYDEMSLAYELSRAIIVKDNALPRHTIRINSYVVIADSENSKEKSFTIVMPQHANINEGRISILTPMAAALIGFRKGDTTTWKMPAGIKRFKILDVINPS